MFIIDQEDSNETNKDYTQTYDLPPTSANKRSHDPLDSILVDVKKIKTEPLTQNAQDAQPGPSNDQVFVK